MSDKKQALKELRKTREATIERAKKNMKAHRQKIKKIKELISGEGKTVPEIAQGMRMPTHEIMWYVATMKKYGLLVEGAKDGDYFKYQAA